MDAIVSRSTPACKRIQFGSEQPKNCGQPRRLAVHVIKGLGWGSMAVPTLHVKVQPASDVNTEYIVFSSGIDQGIYIDHAEPSLDINREQRQVPYPSTATPLTVRSDHS